jgi:hypothetical protein
MRKIIDYHIIKRNNFDDLIREVRSFIHRGWECLGGPQYTNSSSSYDQDAHFQGMVKYEGHD